MIAVGLDDLQDLAALDAFDQNFDVAVGQLQALHDVDDGADLVDVVGLGLVDGGVVLGGQKDLLVGGQSLFESAHAGLAAHDERRHHVGKDDHVPNGHHGQLLALEFFFGCGSTTRSPVSVFGCSLVVSHWPSRFAVSFRERLETDDQDYSAWPLFRSWPARRCASPPSRASLQIP
jgi:hypothetical protein